MGLENSPQSALSSGNLFAPPSGQRRVEDGWRAARQRPSLLLAVGGMLLIGGALFALNRQGRQKRDL
jgi:hypothetical protein